ncbi:RICIN domain-containing protein [Streptomyces sp. NPDC090306]|uniref:RICIN domain-containing protein n=1 Tax=unclassified Streptomyces TaxID=2593676 RepID=UPI0036E3A765
MPARKDPSAAPAPGSAAAEPGPTAAAPEPEPTGAPTPTVASTFAALAPGAATGPRRETGAGASAEAATGTDTSGGPASARTGAPTTPPATPAAASAPGAAEESEAAGSEPSTERPDGSGPPPAGDAATAEPAAPEAGAAAVAVAADPGDGGDGDAEAAAASAPGRPRGPVLAAAGIVGTLLIAAPFLIPAFAGDKPEHPKHTQAAGGTDLGSAADSSPVAGYGSASPSPSAKPSASKAAKKHVTAAAPVVEPQASFTTAVKPSASPSATKKAAKKPSARARANTASSQSKVLLKNVTTGMCADIPYYQKGKVNGPVNQYYCDGTSADNQLWNLVVHPEAGKGPEGSSLFLISNVKDGLCFDLPNYTAAAGGTRITEFPCQATKSDNQYWWLDPRSDGTYWIRNYASRDLCLNVAGNGNGGHDAALQIGTCNDSSDDDDHWYFAKS